MRVLAVIVVALAASCSLWSSNDAPDARAPDAPVDACALPRLPVNCIANAFAALPPDGAWHMTGSATTTVTGVDSNGSATSMTTSSMIDRQAFIATYGCVAGFGYSAMPPADPHMLMSATGVSFSCDHEPQCMRGTSSWTLCVRDNGQLVYEYSASRTSTMPSAYQTIDRETAVLTR